MNTKILERKHKNYFTLFFLLLLIPLILNGYPIIFSDTGTLIHAFDNITSLLHPPLDRPIFYSVFFYITSIGRTSLFFTCIAQDALIAYLLYDYYNNRTVYNKPLFFLMLIYLPFSYVSILSNTVITDIWLGISFLSSYMIFDDRKIFYSKLFIRLFLIYISSLFAPANGVIIILSLVFLSPILFFYKDKKRIYKSLTISIVITLGLLTCAFDNYLSYNIFSPIADSNTFFVGRLIGDNLCKSEITNICSSHNFHNTSACINDYQYLHRNGQTFLWGHYNHNFSPWDLSNQLFFEHVKDVCLHKKFFNFADDIVTDGFTTLLSLPNNLGSLYGKYNSNTYVQHIIKKYFNSYSAMHSWQQERYSSFDYLSLSNKILIFLLAMSFGHFLIDLYYKKKENILLILFAYFAIVVNAFIDGGLSMINPRYNIKGFGIILVLMCFLLSARFSTDRLRLGDST